MVVVAFLGFFDDREAAHQSYLQAKAELHPFAPKVRPRLSRSNAPLSGFVTTDRYVLDRQWARTILRRLSFARTCGCRPHLSNNGEGVRRQRVKLSGARPVIIH
jgi:hypothetical protein